jgi:alginate O-acetyltransferase complex protein AlgF
MLPHSLSVFSRLRRAACALPAMLLCCAALAQTQPGLYDPEPPANSAYVRIVHAASDGALELMVDGKPRLSPVERGTASDYMVLAAGPHQLEIRQGGKTRLTLPLEAAGAHALTLAFTSLAANSKPMVFEDKTIANKLKATLAVYHLHPGFENVDIATLDGKLTVFPALAAGNTAVRAVNPISIELVANKSETKLQVARTKLNLSQGGSYSILLLADTGGKLIATSQQNRIERYTGK